MLVLLLATICYAFTVCVGQVVNAPKIEYYSRSKIAGNIYTV